MQVYGAFSTESCVIQMRLWHMLLSTIVTSFYTNLRAFSSLIINFHQFVIPFRFSSLIHSVVKEKFITNPGNLIPHHPLLIFHFPIRTTDEGAVKNCIPHTPAQKMRPQRANQAEKYLSKSYLSMPRWQRLIVVSCCWWTNHGWVPPKTLAKNGCQRKFVESCHLTGDLILSWPDVLLHRS